MRRKSLQKYLLLLMFLAWPLDFMSAQVEEAWVARYGFRGFPTPGNVATALALDAEGNVYVTGWSSGLSTGEDYLTIKYDGEGQPLWEARYNGPGNYNDRASALAVDPEGNVYVTGSSFGIGQDYATIKYDSEGNELWVARYNGPANAADNAVALAIDAQGNVYVTGDSLGAGSQYEYATVKYDQDGNQIWVARYNESGSVGDRAKALAVDSDGNVYVTGLGNAIGYITIKYDTDGNRLWVARYRSSGAGSGNAIAVDAEGNVYVTGASGEIGAHQHYATVKYDPEGNQLWAARYEGPAHEDDWASALAVDREGNVYVTGGSYGIDTLTDYATIKYDPEGKEVWVARYDGPAHYDDVARALVLDPEGNVYVTGWSTGIGTEYDYATIKYDPEGNPRWVARYDGPSHSLDGANALAIGADGAVYVTGRSVADRVNEYATIKYVQK